MSCVYYNEFDPFAAQWLRNLISAGHLPAGEVDERSICDVSPADLIGFSACHFFAGIGGWPLAGRLAGLPDDFQWWSGSPPCQPFSSAGKRQGFDDPRDLWPVLRRLVAERRPAILFGEQSAQASAWLARLRSDLEAMGYAVGAMPIEAASIGADHARDRFWFVANANGEGQRIRALNAEMASPPALAADTYGEPMERSAEPRCQRDPWASEPGMDRVAHGIPGRMAKLRALGNAIVPPLAAQFIAASLDAIECAELVS